MGSKGSVAIDGHQKDEGNFLNCGIYQQSDERLYKSL
jgi:hypothetical protein